MTEGGLDILFATTILALCDGGWGEVEAELYEMNEKLRLNSTLPSWIISSFRFEMRTELVLCDYRMTKRHAEILGSVLNSARRLKRLVLQHNPFGCKGTVAIAKALATNETINTLHLTGCAVGDLGATALAAALGSNRALTFLHLESNEITDSGASALAEALLHRNRTLLELLIRDNCLTEVGNDALVAAFQLPRKVSCLRVNTMRPWKKKQLTELRAKPKSGWQRWLDSIPISLGGARSTPKPPHFPSHWFE